MTEVKIRKFIKDVDLYINSDCCRVSSYVRTNLIGVMKSVWKSYSFIGKDRRGTLYRTIGAWALRTVNSTRSAYGCFLFSPTFFQHYDDGSGQICSQDSEEDTMRCKIFMKSCLSVFRSMSNIEKTVERCQITLNLEKARLVFKLYCKHGIVKTHNLAFIECETLQAVFSKDLLPNKLTAQAKLLVDAVVNFQNNQEEVTLTVSPEKILLRNYVDDEPDPTKVIHTVLSMDPDEFDNCQVGVDTSITFCLRELRAILYFVDITGMPLSVQFETAGRPVIFTIDADSAFEANFVLATLAENMTQSTSTQPAQTSTYNKSSMRSRGVSSSVKRKAGADTTSHNHTKASTNKTTQHNSRTESTRNDRVSNAYDDLMDEDFNDEITVPNIARINDKTNSTNSNRTVGQRSNNAINSDRNEDEGNSSQPFSSTNSRLSLGERELARDVSRSSPHTSTSNSYVSPAIPNQSLNKPSDLSIGDVVMEEDEEEPVPGTPPKKRFRSMFFGMSQASTCSEASQRPPSRPSNVLVEDTDEEDD